MVKDHIRSFYGKVYKWMFLSRNYGNYFPSVTYDTTQALSSLCDHYDTYQRLHHYTTDLMQQSEN